MPNIWECWNNRTATFMILGDICTRRCHYCAVKTGRPESLDTGEPARVADAVQTLTLRHIYADQDKFKLYKAYGNEFSVLEFSYE